MVCLFGELHDLSLCGEVAKKKLSADRLPDFYMQRGSVIFLCREVA